MNLQGQGQNGGGVSNSMQNPAASYHQNTPSVDPELVKARKFVTGKIYEFFMKRQKQGQETPPKRMLDLVRRLEEGLFKSAASKEEYMNLATLENRLHGLIRRPPLNNHNQQFSHLNSSSSSVGTVIPTPGMPQSGNSGMMATSSIDNALVSGNNNNVGNFLPPANGPSGGVNVGPFSSSHGHVANGYQQFPSSYSSNPSENNMATSMDAQRMASQMIPTPRFNNITNENVQSQSYMNLEPSNNIDGISNVEPMIVSQQPQQKQNAGGQTSRILHNLGSHMGGGFRSSLQQSSYGLPSGSSKSALRMTEYNSQLINGPAASEGNLKANMYGNSPRHFDQHQQPLMQGDGYGVSTADSSGSGTSYIPVMSVRSVMNNQNLNTTDALSVSKRNSPLMSTQSNLNFQNSHQVTNRTPHKPSEKMSFPSHQRQQFHQQSNLFQLEQLVEHRNGQKQQSQQQQLLFKNDTLVSSHTPSEQSIQLKSEPERREETLHAQVPQQFQLPDMGTQFSHHLVDDPSSSQLMSLPSGPRDICLSHSQTSEDMHQSFPNQLVADSQTVFRSLSAEDQSRGEWCPKSQDASEIPGGSSHKSRVQEDFHQNISGRDDSKKNTVSFEVSITAQPVATQPEGMSNFSGSVSRSNNRDREFRDQQRWLLFLRHARRCPAPEGKCLERHCTKAQNLLKHMEQCDAFKCPHPRCHKTKLLINHHRNCLNASCPVCIPVKKFLQSQLKAYARPELSSSLPNFVDGSCKPYSTGEVAGMPTLTTTPVVVENSEDLEPSIKRLKIDKSPQSVVPESERTMVPDRAVSQLHTLQETELTEQHHSEGMPMKSEAMETKTEVLDSGGQESPESIQMKKDSMNDTYLHNPDGDLCMPHNPSGFAEQEGCSVEEKVDEVGLEDTSRITENSSGSKSGKPKVKGVSLIELFTPEQVREHIKGLRKWVGQSKAKAEKNQALEHSMSENSCQLCAVEKLAFEPPPLYCTPCGARIKRNAMYYMIGSGETRHFFCIPCFNEARGDTIRVDGSAFSKARMEKKKNDEEAEEWWVQCDRCEAWQHQICALFNGRRNDGGQADYTCPNCYIEEVERGERKPLPQSSVLGAKDLPRTCLSDHIEQRLARKLKQERQDRAKFQGKTYDEVPGAEGLVVRVVSSVDKKLDVKPRFLEIFKEENYPPEFSYKSKVLLLFQKIEGVEVCLFGMYVQEFGSECQQPNHRRVYLSYLDSVKYFRPDVRAVTGDALRTFVYHEILIGYLEYCKMRGFTSCYIWACPPLKGEDYILYCHPEIQKTPKSDKLREWYLAMLRKAVRENIAVELTNLYDHFFVSTGECKAKVTAARLPYFDGDYWPGAAEDIIYQLQQEEEGRKHHRRGTFKKSITKRVLKASGQIDLSSNASKDLMLMHKLGETISPMKEDFIMVHLQHACTHCCLLMVCGNRWVCKVCKHFQICDRCYEAEQKLEDRAKHPINQKEKHLLYPVEINNVSVDTKDKDDILESEFFDTRQAFLSLCQGNHYQYDTLRRAKHSSMMILYHLHNPTAPAFISTCSTCYLDIEAGQGWRCETCPDYDICNACYQKDGGKDHPHKLINHPSLADRDAQNKEARQLRVLQLRKMLDLLVHASQCRSGPCQYPNCRKVKGLFRHGMVCRIRASGGCVLCKKMWYLLQIHSRACKESQCNVPRCKDLREHLRRLQQQSDSRRRAAVMEMMRQRAAEVAGSP